MCSSSRKPSAGNGTSGSGGASSAMAAVPRDDAHGVCVGAHVERSLLDAGLAVEIAARQTGDPRVAHVDAGGGRGEVIVVSGRAHEQRVGVEVAGGVDPNRLDPDRSDLARRGADPSE